jgi:hypothetical protein
MLGRGGTRIGDVACDDGVHDFGRAVVIVVTNAIPVATFSGIQCETKLTACQVNSESMTSAPRRNSGTITFR